MMTKKDTENWFKIEFNSIDALAPKNHLVRKIDAAIGFNFIYDEVAELYATSCTPSIDPVVLIKIVLIQYLFGIPSITESIISIATDAGYITPHICKTIFADNILPSLPYKRPMIKEGFI